MKKKACIVVFILAIIGLLTGISVRGIGGVNYGRVIFPALVGLGAIYYLTKTNDKTK